jgi:glutamyl-Q tRNA(Asp) synthetase
MTAAIAAVAGPLAWTEGGWDTPDFRPANAPPLRIPEKWREIAADPAAWGDVVLGRRDVPTSYHLAVVLDDAVQAVSDIVRGRDLFFATAVHRLLQKLLGLPAPRYRHHPLVLDGDGRKLSKSAGARSLRALRDAGTSAAEVRTLLGF